MADIQKDILLILNSGLTINSKRMEIKRLNQRRRSQNRILLRVVERLLYEYTLPSTAKDEFSSAYFTELNEQHYVVLEKLLANTDCQFFCATCGELLWQYKRKYKAAIKALHAYSQELISPSFADEHHILRVRMSICRIFSRCTPKEYDFDAFFDNCLAWLKECNNLSTIMQMTYSLGKCMRRDKRLENYIQGVFEKKAEENCEQDLISLGEFLLNDFYPITKSKCENRSAILKVIAQAAERFADHSLEEDPSEAFRAVSFYKDAIQYWTNSELPEAREQKDLIMKKLEHAQLLSLERMQSFKMGPFDVKEIIEHFRAYIDKNSFENVLWAFTHLIPLENVKTVQDKQHGIFDDLVSKPVLDERGKTKYVVPPRTSDNEEDRIAWCEHEAAVSYRFAAEIQIQHFLHLAKSRFEFNEETLRFLVEPNLFIPKSRKSTFLKGLIAGFNMDLPVSMSLLMPQVEYAIRSIAEMCGVVVYKSEPDGTEEVFSLDSILRNDKLVGLLEDDFLFNLRVFYTSKYGFGMRNQVCHGLKSDEELHDAAALATWWFTLRLCCEYSGNIMRILYGKKKD